MSVLHTRCWGRSGGDPVVCVHGIGQHGGIFEEMALRLAELDHRVVSVDLRGHGNSDREPPWNTDTHVDDLLQTADSLDVGAATWIGHSFGGRLIATLADREP